MNCREFEDDLFMLLEPEDGTARRRDLESHAAACGSCARAERGYRATVRLGKLAFRDAGEGLEEEVEELVAMILAARLRQLSPAESKPN